LKLANTYILGPTIIMAIIEPASPAPAASVKIDLDQPMPSVLSNPDLPLSSLLRDGTAQAHEIAEKSEGAKLLVSGELDKMEYIRYLMMLWHVYDALEAALEVHSTHPILAPTYNPTVLFRSQRITSDLAVLLNIPEFNVESHPIHQNFLRSAPDALHTYVDRIEELSKNGDAGRLLAHAYVRYLGDLSGGQFIRRRVAKAYNLSLEDGLGTRFYEFNKLDGSEPTTQADARKIKDWYRNGMNEGVGDDRDVKAAIVEEANRVFELNGALLAALHFAAIDPPPQSPLLKVSPTGRLLGPSESSSASSSSSLSTTEPEEKDLKTGEAKVLFDASANENEGESSIFPTHLIIPFIVAFGIAHFIMVVGGFMGHKGEDKWRFFIEYMWSLFGLGQRAPSRA